MLTDAALKCLKPKAKMYKVADRDGMYVRVAPTGGISFRLDYRLNGRRETVHLGKYARDGISLARARELCLDAKRMIAEGRSPAIEKQRDKRRIKEAKSFGEFGEKWLTGAPMADRVARLAARPSRAPARIRLSSTRRLALCRSMRRQNSHSSAKGPSRSRASRMAWMADSPTPLIAPRP